MVKPWQKVAVAAKDLGLMQYPPDLNNIAKHALTKAAELCCVLLKLRLYADLGLVNREMVTP
jgi:hypothetical protein